MSTAPQELSSAQLRSRNPLLLNAVQEKEVREIYHARVREQCRSELQDWARCCQGRTFTVTWACREQRRIMNTCMLRHATQSEKDAAREQWFQERLKKAEERVKAREGEKANRPMSMMVPARSSTELK